MVEQINIFRGQEEGRAELAHSDFLKSIEKDFEKELGQGNISVTSYKDRSNRDSKMYELNFESIVVNGKTITKKRFVLSRKGFELAIEKITKQND